VEVTHPNSKVALYPLERLTRFQDGMEQLEEDWWPDALSDGHGSDHDDSEGVWTTDQDGIWRFQSPNAVDVDQWDEMDDDDDAMDTDETDWAEEVQTIPSPEIRPSSVEPAIGSSDSNQCLESRQIEDELFSRSVLSADVPKDVTPDGGVDDDSEEDPVRPPWKRFDILPSVPQDHTFYTSPPAQPSKSFLARLTREYRVLESSLPGSFFLVLPYISLIAGYSTDSILVRAFEDRTDLLRSLIIGPENTPYEDAPFVIDWMLDSNFPHSPPRAHFLSWTNGNGRGASYYYILCIFFYTSK